MIVFCALWGFQQVAIKAALFEIPPLWQSGLRSVGASILIGLWILYSKNIWTRGLLLPGIVTGTLFGLEFALIYLSLQYTDAARVVLLIYTAPFIVAIGAHFWIKGDKLSIAGWLGVLIAFTGTAVVLQTSFDIDNTRLIGDLCALFAGIVWGLTTLVVRTTNLSHAAPSQTLFYQLIVSALILCLMALIFEGNFHIPQSMLAWSSMGFQIVIIATLSYLGWFALIARYSATKLSVFSFMTPLFGALSGILFLGETIGIHHIIALVLITMGIIIVNTYGHSNAVK
jgi:drug/metabolite transporter (DMT)-like permease